MTARATPLRVMSDKSVPVRKKNKKRKTVKKSLNDGEAQFRKLIMHAPVAMGIFKEPRHILVFANERLLEFLDKTAEQVLNKSYFEANPEIKGQGFEKILDDVYQTGVRFVAEEIEIALLRRGTLKKVFVKIIYEALRDEDDRTIIGLIVVVTEITEQVHARKKLKGSAERHEFLANAMPQKVWTADAEGNVNYFNQQWYDYTAMSFESLKNWGWQQTIHAEDWGKTQKMWQQSIDTGQDFQIEHRFLRHDGIYRWHLSRSVAQKDQNRKIKMWIGTNTDINEQKDLAVSIECATVLAKEAKEKAESATKVAESALKAKQQFLSNMSHEIRTPMNAIIGFTKVLLKTDVSDRQKEYLTAIKLSGDALIVLINDILDLAKVDAGKMTFEQTPFRMERSIAAMLHLFESKILEKNLALIQIYDHRIPAVLVGDPVRLHQIILNLVGNAVKFTSEGKITVMVRLLTQDLEKVTIEFLITDTGIGISEEKLSAIFENFQQATSETSKVYGGTGLGLAIVKQLVEKQGGHIAVKSKINEGSTFAFTLSFMKTEDKNEVIAEIVELDKEIKNIKVLVVEDMALNQLLMKTLLDDFGFERDIVANGKLALEKLLANSYDIILMDLQMPEMNGFEATAYIRNVMNSNIPIIALTADVTTVDVAKCKAVGMDDYLAKPIDERILYTKIVGLVKKKLFENGQKEKEYSKIALARCTDLGYLSQRTKANPVLMMEMIALYLDQTPPLVAAMKSALMNQDWKTLQAAVHKMIPSFSIMGISLHFEIMAKKIQEYAKMQQATTGMTDMVWQLENVCVQACQELREEFENIKNTKP